MPEPDAPDADERDRQPPDVIPGLAAFAASQADAIIATDLDRRVHVWNRAAETLYGIPAEDARGRTLEELLDTVVIGEEATSSGTRRSTLEHGSWRGRIADRPRIGRRVGTELVIDAVLNRLDGPVGEPLGVMSVNRDITDSVRVEHELATLGLGRVGDLTDQGRLRAQLIQAQKMDATGRLVSGLAHELNNPLASILGFSELIRRDAALPAELRRNADLLVEEATRTRRIVQMLLDFVRLRPPERVSSSIRALVESVLTLQGYGLRHGVVELEVDVPDDLPPVELDRGGMQHVLINLILNAVHALEAGGGSRLRIAAASDAPGERVRITVMDDGIGIPAAAVPGLFDPFSTTRRPGDGRGLGLPVSYDIVAAHGGTLRYAPAPWGRGASFTVELPLRAAAPAAEPAGHPGSLSEPVVTSPLEPLPAPTPRAPFGAGPTETDARPGTGAVPARARILVLDDEPSIRVFLEKALRALGHDPAVTATAAEAVDIAGKGSVAVVLCDHRMAQRSGVEVFSDLVAVRPELADRFVMMSGDVLDPALAAFAEERGLTVLAKPFDLATLDRTVRSVLARRPQPRG